eukprot:maker-scaffold1523_size37540-snap-gene-0.19 protein:Tk02353 transcript:maker-scaffold1523_size37540-snap-gene-0.19-mRNA-1 annotation:"ribonuclease zc3h12b"
MRKLLRNPFSAVKALPCPRAVPASPRPTYPPQITPKRGRWAARVTTPRMRIPSHVSRGFLHSPITIDDSVHDVIDLSDDEPVLVQFLPVSTPRDKRSASRMDHSALTPIGPPPAKRAILELTLEDGELPSTPGAVQPQLDRGPASTQSSQLAQCVRPRSPEVEILSQVGPPAPRSIPEPPSIPVTRGAPRRTSDRFQILSKFRRKGPKVRAEKPPPSPAPEPKRAQISEPIHFNPVHPPNFNFTPALAQVPGGVFHFQGNRQRQVPRMGSRQLWASASQSSMGMSNVYIAQDGPANSTRPGSLRPVVIDGSNVAMAHGLIGRRGSERRPGFSSRGIQLVVDYFKRRGHQEVTAIIPHFRLKSGMSEDRHLLEAMERQGNLMTSPSRDLSHGGYIASYDDRFIVQRATLNGGIVVSNDNYRDLMYEDPKMRDTIDRRLLMFRFVDLNTLMFPTDPLGSKGPSLDAFLKFY